MARKRVERNIAFDDVRRKYYVTMDYGKDQDGKRQKKYSTYPNLTAARRALRSFEVERDSQMIVIPSRLTLGQWMEQWMAEIIEPNRAETTVYGYRKIIENHLDPILGDIVLQELKPRDIQHYYARLKADKELSSNTIRHHHDLLTCCLRTAVKHDLILRNPAERVDPPRLLPNEARFYTPENLNALYKAVDGTWLETVVKLAGCLGLRREEICGLRWSSVDFRNRRIHIREARTAAGASIVQKETKNRSSARTLYMTDEIRSVLRREQRRQMERRSALGEEYADSGFVTVNSRGEAHSPNLVSLAFTRVIRREGLPQITLHGLRHTFATIASAQGAPLFDIGKALGHSTPATTGKIYTHLLDQTHAPTLAKVAAALEGISQ